MPQPSRARLRSEPKLAAGGLTSQELWLQIFPRPSARPSWVPLSYCQSRDRQPCPALEPRGPPHPSPAPPSSPWVVVDPIQPSSLQPFGHGELKTEQTEGQWWRPSSLGLPGRQLLWGHSLGAHSSRREAESRAPRQDKGAGSPAAPLSSSHSSSLDSPTCQPRVHVSWHTAWIPSG